MTTTAIEPGKDRVKELQEQLEALELLIGQDERGSRKSAPCFSRKERIMCNQEHQHKFAMTAEVCTLAEKVACHLAANPAVVDPVRGWTLTDIREASFAIATDIVGEMDKRFAALHAEEKAEIEARRAEAAT